MVHTINTKKYYTSLRENSFHYIGPKLYNSLPRYLRDNLSLSHNDWETILDEFMEKILDLPHTVDTTPGLCDPIMAKPSNSIIHWIPHLKLDDRRGSTCI